MKYASTLIVALILFGCTSYPPKESPPILTKERVTHLPTSWVCSGDAGYAFADCKPFIDYLWEDISSTYSFTYPQ